MINPSAAHQKLVKTAIDAFRGQGFTILEASYSGFPPPKKHGRHEPDIVMKDSNDVLHLVEAKLGDDLSSATAKEQFKDFASRFMIPGSPHPERHVPFHIVTYRKDVFNLIRALSSLNLGQFINKRIFIHWLKK